MARRPSPSLQAGLGLPGGAPTPWLRPGHPRASSAGPISMTTVSFGCFSHHGTDGKCSFVSRPWLEGGGRRPTSQHASPSIPPALPPGPQPGFGFGEGRGPGAPGSGDRGAPRPTHRSRVQPSGRRGHAEAALDRPPRSCCCLWLPARLGPFRWRSRAVQS